MKKENNQQKCPESSLQNIDETSRRLQEQGLKKEALDCLQLGLLKRKELYGCKSAELQNECKRVGKLFVEICKTLEVDEGIDYLHKALKIVKSDRRTKLHIFQLLAELYFQSKHHFMALKCARQVLSLQKSLGDCEIDCAAAMLNVCFHLSNMKKHEAALKQAEAAIELLRPKMPRPNSMQTIRENSDTESVAESETLSTLKTDMRVVEVVALGYHNAGVQFEFLGDIKNCYYIFRHGGEIASQFLGQDHTITEMLLESTKSTARQIVKSGAILEI